MKHTGKGKCHYCGKYRKNLYRHWEVCWAYALISSQRNQDSEAR